MKHIAKCLTYLTENEYNHYLESTPQEKKNHIYAYTKYAKQELAEKDELLKQIAQDIKAANIEEEPLNTELFMERMNANLQDIINHKNKYK